ncbi:MAG: pentapeptide repeat-containing protein, partial [Turicibacter sp.]
HDNLTNQGLKGCTTYDCFGAGQKVSQVTFNKKSWRENKGQAKAMFDVFLVMRQIHEMLWYLEESLKLKMIAPFYPEIELMLKETDCLTYLSVDALQKIDIPSHRFKVNQVLMKISECVRTESRRDQKNQTGRFKAFNRGADLVGKDLRKMDLVGANLRGAYLIAANLSGMDLSGADVIGADFRDANLSGANLSQTLFITQAQINCAKGDHKTKLPDTLLRPTQWIKI